MSPRAAVHGHVLLAPAVLVEAAVVTLDEEVGVRAVVRVVPPGADVLGVVPVVAVPRVALVVDEVAVRLDDVVGVRVRGRSSSRSGADRLVRPGRRCTWGVSGSSSSDAGAGGKTARKYGGSRHHWSWLRIASQRWGCSFVFTCSIV